MFRFSNNLFISLGFFSPAKNLYLLSFVVFQTVFSHFCNYLVSFATSALDRKKVGLTLLEWIVAGTIDLVPVLRCRAQLIAQHSIESTVYASQGNVGNRIPIFAFQSIELYSTYFTKDNPSNSFHHMYAHHTLTLAECTKLEFRVWSTP